MAVATMIQTNDRKKNKGRRRGPGSGQKPFCPSVLQTALATRQAQFWNPRPSVAWGLLIASDERTYDLPVIDGRTTLVPEELVRVVVVSDSPRSGAYVPWVTTGFGPARRRYQLAPGVIPADREPAEVLLAACLEDHLAADAVDSGWPKASRYRGRVGRPAKPFGPAPYCLAAGVYQAGDDCVARLAARPRDLYAAALAGRDWEVAGRPVLAPASGRFRPAGSSGGRASVGDHDVAVTAADWAPAVEDGSEVDAGQVIGHVARVPQSEGDLLDCWLRSSVVWADGGEPLAPAELFPWATKRLWAIPKDNHLCGVEQGGSLWTPGGLRRREDAWPRHLFVTA